MNNQVTFEPEDQDNFGSGSLVEDLNNNIYIVITIQIIGLGDRYTFANLKDGSVFHNEKGMNDSVYRLLPSGWRVIHTPVTLDPCLDPHPLPKAKKLSGMASSP